jgi:hypothetical protein
MICCTSPSITVLANTTWEICRSSSPSKADFVISRKFARSKRQCTDGEFVKKYITGIVSVLDLRKLTISER